MLTPQEVAEKHLTAVKGGDPFQMAEDYADNAVLVRGNDVYTGKEEILDYFSGVPERLGSGVIEFLKLEVNETTCLLYTSPSPRDQRGSRMPSSA